MKKLIVIVASLLIAVSAHAQLGVVAGITSAQTKFDNVDAAIAEAQNATQYHVGVAYKLALGNLIAIQPAILYNVKGSKVSAVGGLGDFDFKSGYLEIPVQLQVGIGLGDLARVYAIAEPFVGMAITETTIKGLAADQKIEWDDFADKLEYGIGIGAGVELIKHVQVAARYFWNMGGAKDANINLNDVKDIVTNKKANGVMASVVLLF
jgi:hypothetical protein